MLFASIILLYEPHWLSNLKLLLLLLLYFIFIHAFCLIFCPCLIVQLENGLVEAVAVLISKMPRLRPESVGKLGECHKSKPDFIKVFVDSIYFKMYYYICFLGRLYSRVFLFYRPGKNGGHKSQNWIAVYSGFSVIINKLVRAWETCYKLCWVTLRVSAWLHFIGLSYIFLIFYTSGHLQWYVQSAYAIINFKIYFSYIVGLNNSFLVYLLTMWILTWYCTPFLFPFANRE